VHLVDEHLDHGPIVMQRAVEVLDGDTVETLSTRILEQEHRIYPEAIARVLSKGFRVEGRRTFF
jgi:phosphoribosylglycinamide formyltransferase-1